MELAAPAACSAPADGGASAGSRADRSRHGGLRLPVILDDRRTQRASRHGCAGRSGRKDTSMLYSHVRYFRGYKALISRLELSKPSCSIRGILECLRTRGLTTEEGA